MVFVSDMPRSVAFYRDQMGLKLRFTSPAWSEFETGTTILALHPAGPNNRAGTSELGVTVQQLNAFYAARRAAGVPFSGPPKQQSYGAPLTEMRDPDGALISVAGR
jgi:lactoylglutathione lyase